MVSKDGWNSSPRERGVYVYIVSSVCHRWLSDVLGEHFLMRAPKRVQVCMPFNIQASMHVSRDRTIYHTHPGRRSR